MIVCLDYSWQPGLLVPTLSNDDVHIWIAPLNLATSEFDILKCLLSFDELEKAARFRSAKDQNHFIVARGLLRIILGNYINMSPEQLCFCHSSYGKPALVEHCGQNEIQFNMSHSHDFALYGIALNTRVGVDLERVCPFPEIEQLAIRFLASNEMTVFKDLPLGEKTMLFFRHWTHNESYIKAKGQNLCSVFDDVAFNTYPRTSSEFINTNEDSVENLDWSFYQFLPTPDYVAALAVEGGNDRYVSFWRWMMAN